MVTAEAEVEELRADSSAASSILPLQETGTPIDEESVHHRHREMLLFDLGVLAPGETPANNSFDDQVVCGRSCPQADTKVNLPLRRDIQITYGEDLLLLIM